MHGTIPEEDPSNLNLIVCGDFNGEKDCGAIHYLENGSVGPQFLEDGEPVSSKEKTLPLSSPLIDATCIDRMNHNGYCPPPTLVVPELISLLIEEGNIETCFIDPKFSIDVLERLGRIYQRYATIPSERYSFQMGKRDVDEWLTAINGRVGRGSEFRSAAKFMGWVEPVVEDKADRPPIIIPEDGILTLDDFVGVYLDELRQGKFWGSKSKSLVYLQVQFVSSDNILT